MRATGLSSVQVGHPLPEVGQQTHDCGLATEPASVKAPAAKTFAPAGVS